MKIFISLILSTFTLSSNAQIKGLLQKANQALGITESKTSNKEEMIGALKEALIIGIQKGATTLSKEDGFLRMIF